MSGGPSRSWTTSPCSPRRRRPRSTIVEAAAGRASAKAAGVIVDDTAVTPRYVQGLDPKRELPIIKKIAIGSLRNKLLFILPAAPPAQPVPAVGPSPLLMIGGTYLCFEGAEKIWEKISHHPEGHADELHEGGQVADERDIVSGAVRTDFIPLRRDHGHLAQRGRQ